MPTRDYASMTLTRDARDALQRAALTLSARVGRRLSMSTVLLALAQLGEAHPDELTSALANGGNPT